MLGSLKENLGSIFYRAFIRAMKGTAK